MTYKSILCLNGDLPGKDFFSKLDLPIIAADGAANKLYAIGFPPDLVIGDLDSVDSRLNLNLIHIEDQNRCDYEKSMKYLEIFKLLPTVVVGIAGGELDHVLNNINIFMSYPCGNLLYAPPLYGTTLCESENLLEIPSHTKVSIIGLPEAKITTCGLAWDLTRQKLYFPGFNSCSNRTTKETLSIQIFQGKVLFLAREFFSMITLFR